MTEPTWVEIELTGVCALGCPGCPRSMPLYQGQYYNKDMSMETLQHVFNMYNPGKTSLSLCGCFGDAIYHKQFHAIIDEIIQRGYHFSVMTAGANRPNAWWDDLAKRDLSNSEWSFSIDGIAENNHIYRRNAKWDSIAYALDTITSMRKRPRTIYWKYIIFPYNEDDVETARQYAHERGIEFSAVRSLRSPHIYDWLPITERMNYVSPITES